MIPTLLFALFLAIAINWVIFLVAYKYQSDKLTDITYSLTFVILTVYSFAVGIGISNAFKIVMALLVSLWAGRLGYYLLRRIYQMGRDKRFDQIRINYGRFFRFFIIQGFGAWIIALPVMISLINEPGSFRSTADFSPWEWSGLLLAFIGFLLESLADWQKSRFKAIPGNSDKLYTSGLFSTIRYPNYTGEIIFWVGIFIASIPALDGIEWLAVLGPVTIILLLLFVSGIPYIEKERKNKYGGTPEFSSYMNNTKNIIPFLY